MNTNKMREQFESAIVAMKIATGMPEDDAKSFLEVGSNGYTSIYTKAAWWAWQASREAALIDLPAGKSLAERMYGPNSKGGDELIHREHAIEAIEVHGLKVAP